MHILTTYFHNKVGPKRDVVQAEVKFGYFLRECHLALMLVDHLFPNVSRFHDCEGL